MEVEIYYNLHKKCLSVREKHGKVVDHTHGIILHKAKFVVQQGGRKKVLEERKKNVHAFVRGTDCSNRAFNMDAAGLLKLTPQLVIYNPYKYRYFMSRGVEQSNLRPIYEAEYVTIAGKHIIAWC